ncbi:TolC family protein [Thermostilla marina]
MAHPKRFLWKHGWLWGLTVCVLGGGAIGCHNVDRVRDTDYVEIVHRASYSTTVDEAVLPPDTPAGPLSLDACVRLALERNPRIQAARKKIEALAYRVPSAASLPDPTMNVTAAPAPIQTAAGEQDLLLGITQKVPLRRKLEAKADAAEARADAARAEFAAVELATVAEVKKAYYQLQFVEQAIEITQADLLLLTQLRNVAESRYRTGQTSQQDVLRAEVEMANVRHELIQLERQRTGARAKLASLMHISPEAPIETTEPANENLAHNLAELQARAVRNRPELHAKLASLAASRKAAQLARLQYLPDVVLGATWIAVDDAGISPVRDGEDAFLLNVGVNLPIYRRRLEADVRSAEAEAVAVAKEYDALRDETLREVIDLVADAQSKEELIRLFEADILPKARQTLEVSSQAYNVGQTDFLQLIDNWRQLLRYEIAHRQLQTALRQTLADLERIVGGSMDTSAGVFEIEDVPVPALPE